MSVIATITTELVSDHYLITVTLNPSSDIPQSVFIYTNTGDGTLGEYQGVCSIDELTRLKQFQPGVVIPIFGNKFLRHTEAKIKVAFGTNPSLVSDSVKNALKLLSSAYGLARSNTVVVTL